MKKSHAAAYSKNAPIVIATQVLERDRRFGVTRRTDTPNQRVHIVAAAQVRDSWPAGRLLHARQCTSHDSLY
jgi:hypothetical protein